MLSQRNITHVIVGKDDDLVTSGETRADMIAGQIGVFLVGSSAGKTDALTAGQKCKVVYKNTDGYLIESPIIEYNNILEKNATDYVVDTEQKTYVGYNGTSGSIEVNNSEKYYIHLDRKDSSNTWGEYTQYKLVAGYTSAASATETEIADALVVNADKNLRVEKIKSGRWVTKAGRISSAATAAGYDFDGNLTVVQDSKYMTAASSGQYNSGTDIVVGDYIRLGATSTTAVAVTSQVYKITAISGTTTKTITLDRPVLEASGTYATGSNYSQVIPSATAIAANWGLSFESVAVKFVPGLFKNQQVTFNVSLSDAFGSTTITEATSAFKGSGTYEEVAENEWFLSGNRGFPARVADYPITKNLNATLGKTYDTIVIRFKNTNSTDLNGDVNSYITLLIYTEEESAATAYTDLKTVFGIS